MAMAIIVFTAPDLLVLDEPSTHLDIDSITALIHALRKFGGAVLLVSHDRHLVRCVVEGKPILQATEEGEEDEYISDSDIDSEDEAAGAVSQPGKVYKVGPKGRVRELPGGMDAYNQSMEKMMKKLAIT